VKIPLNEIAPYNIYPEAIKQLIIEKSF
jgi:hypothetical protein